MVAVLPFMEASLPVIMTGLPFMEAVLPYVLAGLLFMEALLTCMAAAAAAQTSMSPWSRAMSTLSKKKSPGLGQLLAYARAKSCPALD